MEVKLNLDNDTIARLAVGAMKDGVAMDKYIETAVVELSKLIDDTGSSEQIKDLTSPANNTVGNEQVFNEDVPVFTPEQKHGGPGAPLYSKKSSSWKL